MCCEKKIDLVCHHLIGETKLIKMMSVTQHAGTIRAAVSQFEAELFRKFFSQFVVPYCLPFALLVGVSGRKKRLGG